MKQQVSLVLADLCHAPELNRLIVENRAFLGQWLPWPDTVKSVADTEEYIINERMRFAEGQALYLCILQQSSIAGVITIKEIVKETGSGILGYWLGETFCGRGIMTRAVCGCMELGREKLGLKGFEIRCAVGNLASRQVAERSGFQLTAYREKAERINGVWRDQCVYRYDS